MNSSIYDLKELDFATLKNIEFSVVSIFKINKSHHLFESILEANPPLKEAEYIIYPNVNNSTKKIFLKETGAEILSYSKGVSEFILLPSELDSSENNPILIINNSTTENSVSNYSW